MESKVGRYVLPGFLTVLLLGGTLPGNAQAPSKAEKQLTQRVEQLYRFFVAGNWKAVEPFIAPDTVQLWLEQPKAKVDSFEIKEVQIAPGGKEADVTVLATFRIAQSPSPFTQPQQSKWVYEKRKWFLKVRRPPTLSALFNSSPNPLNNPAEQKQQPALGPVDGEQLPSTDLDRVQVGVVAPDFRLADEQGNVHQLSQYRDKKNVVLVVYRGYW